MNSFKRLAIVISLVVFSIFSYAENVVGPIADLERQKRTFSLNGGVYHLPKTIPIKYLDMADEYFDFEELNNGSVLQVLSTQGDGEVKTVLEVYILPQ